MGQKTITAFVPVAQHSDTSDLPAVEEASCGRGERALSEDMSVTAETENGAATGLYEVESESGSTYTVDLEAGRCGCPDHQHRRAKCKHLRRVAMAITYTNLAAPDVVIPGSGSSSGAEDEGASEEETEDEGASEEETEDEEDDEEENEVAVRLHNGMRVVPDENQDVDRFGSLVEEDETGEEDTFDMEQYKQELDEIINEVIPGRSQAGA